MKDGKITFDDLFDFTDKSSLERLEKSVISIYEKSLQLINGLEEASKSMRDGIIKTAEELNQKQKAVNITTEKGREEMLTYADATDKLVDAEKKLNKTEKELILNRAKLREEQEILKGQFKDTVREAISLEAQIKKLQATNKELEATNKRSSQSYIDNRAKIIELKTELQKLNQANKTAVKEINAQEASYEQLNAMYIRLTKEHNALSEAETQSETGQGMLATITALDVKLKELDASMGKHQRNVGNYESGTVSLRTELMKMRNELGAVLQEMRKMEAENKKLSTESNGLKDKLSKVNTELGKLEGNKGASKRVEELKREQNDLKNKIEKTSYAIQENTQRLSESNEKYRQAATRAGEMQDAYQDVQRNIKALASDTATIDGVVNSVQGLVGVFSAAQGAAALFGNENEDLRKTFVKLQALMTIMTGLQQLQNMLQKQSAANQLRLKILTAAQNGVEAKGIVVRGASIAVTKLAAAAQLFWNKTIMAFPLFWIIAGITAIIAVITKLSFTQKENAETLRSMQKSHEDFIRSYDDIIQKQKEQIEIMKASGKTQIEVAAQVSKNSIENNKELSKQIDDRKKKIEEGTKSYTVAEYALMALNIKVRKQMTKDQLTELQKQNDDLREKRNEAIQITRESLMEQRVLQQQAATNAKIIIEDSRKTERQIEEDAIKEKYKNQLASVEGAKEAMQIELNAIDEKYKKIRQKENEAAKKEREDKEKHLKELADKQRKAELDTLKDLQELAVIREKEQQKEYEKIFSNQEISINERIDAAYKFEQSQEKIISDAMDLRLKDTELTEIQRAIIIENSYKELSDLYENSEKTITELTKEQIERQSEIRISQIQKQVNEIKGQYLSGQISLLDYTAEIERIERQSATMSLEIEIDKSKQLLELAIERGEGIIEAEKRLSDAELALQDETLNQKLMRDEEYYNERKQLQDIGLETLQVATQTANELSKISSDKQISDLEKQKEHELSLVGDNATAKEQIEKKYQTQIAAEKRKQAKADKLMAVFSIALNTSIAVTRALADLKYPLSLATAIQYGVIGAAQLAVALAKPLPGFKKGTKNAPEGFAVVSEAGQELWERNGKMTLTPEKPSVVYLKKGDKIHPADSSQTKLYKDTYSSLGKLSHESKSSENKQLTAAALQMAFGSAIENMPVTVQHWNDNGYQKYTGKKLSRAKRLHERNQMGGKG